MAPSQCSPSDKNKQQLLNKDFYHTTAANLEVKSKAPNGVVYDRRIFNLLFHSF